MVDDLLPDDLDNLRGTRRRRLSSAISAENQTPTPSVPSCDVEQVSKGKVVSYKTPAPPTLPPTSEAGLLAEHLKEMNAILDRNNNILAKIEEYLSYKTATNTYFEIQTTSTFPTPPNALNPNQDPNNLTDGINPGYDQIQVNDALHGRNAPRIWLVNDGSVPTGVNTGSDIFVITSTDGQSWSPEFRVAFGETRIIADVYEIRFRCPVPGNFVRASEREIIPPYVSTIIVAGGGAVSTTANRPTFIARRIVAPLAGVSITGAIPIPTPIPNGFSVAVRANVDNAGASRVYVADTQANTGVAGNRITLAPGDVTRIFITDAANIFVASLPGGQNVDWIIEQ